MAQASVNGIQVRLGYSQTRKTLHLLVLGLDQ